MASLNLLPLPHPRPRQRRPVSRDPHRSGRRRPRHTRLPPVGRGRGVYGLEGNSGRVRQVAVFESKDQGPVRHGGGFVSVSDVDLFGRVGVS